MINLQFSQHRHEQNHYGTVLLIAKINDLFQDEEIPTIMMGNPRKLGIIAKKNNCFKP
jgi:hypothetical protein